MSITLKAARVNKGLTQGEAAKLLHVTRSTLHKYETGKNFPTVLTLKRMERLYGVKYEDLIFLPVDNA